MMYCTVDAPVELRIKRHSVLVGHDCNLVTTIYPDMLRSSRALPRAVGLSLPRRLLGRNYASTSNVAKVSFDSEHSAIS